MDDGRELEAGSGCSTDEVAWPEPRGRRRQQRTEPCDEGISDQKDPAHTVVRTIDRSARQPTVEKDSDQQRLKLWGHPDDEIVLGAALRTEAGKGQRTREIPLQFKPRVLYFDGRLFCLYLIVKTYCAELNFPVQIERIEKRGDELIITRVFAGIESWSCWDDKSLRDLCTELLDVTGKVEFAVYAAVGQLRCRLERAPPHNTEKATGQ